MHQQALATLILRIIGFYYFFLNLSGVLGSFLFALQNPQWAEEARISFLTSMTSFIGIQFFFGLVLIVFARRFARLLFPKNEVLISAEKLNTETLIRAAVPLMGLFLAVHTFPKFIYNAYLWFLEQAHPTSNSFHSPIESQLIQYTILMILSLLILFRNKTLCKRLTKDPR